MLCNNFNVGWFLELGNLSDPGIVLNSSRLSNVLLSAALPETFLLLATVCTPSARGRHAGAPVSEIGCVSTQPFIFIIRLAEVIHTPLLATNLRRSTMFQAHIGGRASPGVRKKLLQLPRL